MEHSDAARDSVLHCKAPHRGGADGSDVTGTEFALPRSHPMKMAYQAIYAPFRTISYLL